jgi:AcrR family transcriptional regulator
MAGTTKKGATRDRAATQEAIRKAAKDVLAEEGFGAFGVNTIARRAGCDKQLIYRYFGGLDGLVDAIGNELAELFQQSMAEPGTEAASSYAAFIEHMIMALVDAFRSSDLLLRIAAWEVIDNSPVVRQLAEVRGKALAKWIEQRRGKLAPPAGVDSGAINATLIAAVQHLCLSGKAVKGFGGVGLETEADWQRIKTALSVFIQAGYRTSDASTSRIGE